MVNVWTQIVQTPRYLLVAVVRLYQLTLRPWVGNVCRFDPSCSSYALQALQQHGAFAGSALSGWRLLRCQPWCNGGCDPVPETLSNPALGLFTRLFHIQAQRFGTGATPTDFRQLLPEPPSPSSSPPTSSSTPS